MTAAAGPLAPLPSSTGVAVITASVLATMVPLTHLDRAVSDRAVSKRMGASHSLALTYHQPRGFVFRIIKRLSGAWS
jgi:hypothetical protein